MTMPYHEGHSPNPTSTTRGRIGFEADAYLTPNGSATRDPCFGYGNSNLPWGLGGKVCYDFFETDSGGVDIGGKFNALLSGKINNNLTGPARYPHFMADEVFNDTDVFWFEATFKF